MGPTSEQTDAIKQYTTNLNDVVNNQQAIDWSQAAQILSQIIQLILSAHVK